MFSADSLPDPLIELVAQRLRLIGEPMRIRVLDRKCAEPHGVCELAEALGASQQNVSKHLAILHEAGIVSRRKVGNRVIYAITDRTVFTLCQTVCGALRGHADERGLLLELPTGSSRTVR